MPCAIRDAILVPHQARALYFSSCRYLDRTIGNPAADEVENIELAGRIGKSSLHQLRLDDATMSLFRAVGNMSIAIKHVRLSIRHGLHEENVETAAQARQGPQDPVERQSQGRRNTFF